MSRLYAKVARFGLLKMRVGQPASVIVFDALGVNTNETLNRLFLDCIKETAAQFMLEFGMHSASRSDFGHA